MRIKRLTYKDHARNWFLEEVEFPENLTLLVGASGVGKSQILTAISNLKEIANGKSFNGVEWELEFEDAGVSPIVWKGKFENKKIPSQPTTIDELKLTGNQIEFESLNYKREKLLERKGAETTYWGNSLFSGSRSKGDQRKVPLNESAVFNLRSESFIDTIQYSFRQLISANHFVYSSLDRELGWEIVEWPKESIDSLALSDSIPLLKKLYLLHQFKNENSVFREITSSFQAVFPSTESVRVVSKQDREGNGERILSVQIKERGNESWISEEDISAGMLKVFVFIAQLRLALGNKVFLIDEFEDSLGVNCIDAVTDQVISAAQNHQFILTSHHPYIINNIPMKSWKVVTRKGGHVSAKNAAEYNLGRSKHEAFTQLINLEEFSEGINVG